MKTTCLIVLLALVNTSCASLAVKMMTSPVRISEEDIYDFEEEHYPKSSWFYHGHKGRFHYFERSAVSKEGSLVLDLHSYKLPKELMPDVVGFPYDSKGSPSRSADVEIHKEFIRIEIDGEQPQKIPFKSKGFITAEHRPENRETIIEADGVDVTERVREAFGQD